MNTFSGSCHCGALGVVLSTEQSPADLPIRVCACSFCLRHGALYASDPAGTMQFTAHDPSVLVRYRFALLSADFWVCARCGVYIGAVMDNAYAVINIRALNERAAFTSPPTSCDYDGETVETRRARRIARWTPATVSMSIPVDSLAQRRDQQIT